MDCLEVRNESLLQICLIMDEVDGMSGGDRGGVSELINIIKSSKVPIICICNDKWNQKLKSLRNSTLDLDFRLTFQLLRRLLPLISTTRTEYLLKFSLT